MTLSMTLMSDIEATAKKLTFTKMKYYGEEGIFETDSYKTQTPSSPDSCFTDTRSCVCEETTILQGDFLMNSCKGLPEFTLGIIKPDGMKYLSQIIMRIKKEGFEIVKKRRLRLSPEQASNLYHDYYGNLNFPLLVTNLCEGDIEVLILRRKDAVAMWKILCGSPSVMQAKKLWPESLRAIFGNCENDFMSICHASESEEHAKREMKFFFPNLRMDSNFENLMDVQDYLNEYVNPILLEGLTQICKNKPLDPIIWLATWLLMNNPYKPRMKEEIAFTST